MVISSTVKVSSPTNRTSLVIKKLTHSIAVLAEFTGNVKVVDFVSKSGPTTAVSQSWYTHIELCTH